MMTVFLIMFFLYLSIFLSPAFSFSFSFSFPQSRRIPTSYSFPSSSSSSSPRSLRSIKAFTSSISIQEDSQTYKSTTPDLIVEGELSVADRLSRAISFYSTALPVFIAYQALDTKFAFRRQQLGEIITAEEEEKAFKVLHEWGSVLITAKINELKGFYVKTGQIISTRVDIFPVEYTSKLAMMQDSLDPVPGDIIKDIVKRDLLDGAEMNELFMEFDDKPLGSASIAQVHKAKLLDGRIVAVKVQRPGVGPKLLGDIANLKNFALLIKDFLPIDYYKIFCELERTLIYELDFYHEAQATAKVASAVAHSTTNKPKKPPVVVPLPIPGLVSKRVIVMDFIDGIALSKLAAEMQTRDVKAGSTESKLLGKKLLSALTDAYACMIFGSGVIHGDPHPGNIFVLEGAEVALLDCGQVKQLTISQRMGLARLVISVNDWEKAEKQSKQLSISSPNSIELRDAELKVASLTKLLAKSVRNFGVFFKEGAGDDCAAAVAILLFGSTGIALPGGYAGEEISKDSPIVQVLEFPSEFILLGRATVMIKGIANRLGVPWGLSDIWSVSAREAIAATSASEILPIWSVALQSIATTQPSTITGSRKKIIRFKDVTQTFVSWTSFLKQYLYGKLNSLFKKYIPDKMIKFCFKYFLKIYSLFEKGT